MRGFAYVAASLTLVAVPPPLWAAPPSDAVRLPLAPAVPPMPPPAPQPAGPVALGGAEWYVIDSDVPLIVLASPEGLVKVTEESGPVRMRGLFVGGGGKVETKTFSGKHVFTVEAVAKGTVELLVVPVGAKTGAEIIRRTLAVDAQNPIPPPQPKPPDPKLPDGRLGLVKVSRDALALSAVPAAEVKALAAQNRSFASALAAGAHPDPAASAANVKAVLAAWGKGNVGAVGDPARWAAWGAAVQKHLFALYQGGRLKTKADWVDAFNEIAEGMGG